MESIISITEQRTASSYLDQFGPPSFSFPLLSNKLLTHKKQLVVEILTLGSQGPKSYSPKKKKCEKSIQEGILWRASKLKRETE